MKRTILIIGLVIASLLLLDVCATKSSAYWLTHVKHWLIEESQIEDTPIGETTPSTGIFTSLKAKAGTVARDVIVSLMGKAEAIYCWEGTLVDGIDNVTFTTAFGAAPRVVVSAVGSAVNLYLGEAATVAACKIYGVSGTETYHGIAIGEAP